MKLNTSRLLNGIFTFCILYLTVFIVSMPQNCLSAAKRGIDLCLNTVIPSLFPFFVCSGILSASSLAITCGKALSVFMRPLFRLPGASAITFLLGTVSGYPVGAASATELYLSGQCTKTEAERMTAFCNNSSPLFVIGVVGTGLLGNPVTGYLLYASHILSALIVGLFFRYYGNPTVVSQRYLPAGEKTHNKKAALFSFGGIIDSSVFNTLKVCGFIIFFSIVTEAIPDGFFKPFLCSLAEISGGLQILIQSAPTAIPLLPLVSFFLGLSGISVLLQITTIIIPGGLSPKPMLAGKLLQGIVSFVVTFVMTKNFPLAKPAFFSAQPILASDFSVTDHILTSILSVVFVVMMLKGAIYLSFILKTKND